MEYLLLIYSEEKREPQPGTPEGDSHFNAYMKFSEEVQQKKLVRGSNALQDISTATTVRVRNGKTETTDGPFAETKEQLGGFYMLDCDNLDDAIQWAARIPHATGGTIEVRPVIDFG